MAEQLIALKSHAGDPWAALAQSLGNTVGNTAQSYGQGVKDRRQNAPLTPEQIATVQKGQVPGGLTREQGLSLAEKQAAARAQAGKTIVPVDQGVMDVYKKAGLQAPTDPQVSAREFQAVSQLAQRATSHTVLDEPTAAALSKKSGLPFEAGQSVDNKILAVLEKPASKDAGPTEQQKIRAAEVEDKRWDTFVQKMDAAKASSRSLLGQAMQNNMRTRRALLTTDDPSAIPQQLDAAFADYAGVMKGSAPDKEAMSSMKVTTLASKWANLKQEITSKPTAVNTPEVQAKLKAMLQDVIKVDDSAIGHWIDYHEKANKSLISKHPDEWKAMKDELKNMTAGENSGAGKYDDVITRVMGGGQ